MKVISTSSKRIFDYCVVEQFIKTNSFCPDEILIVLKQYLSHNLSEVPNFCRASSLAMNKCYLKITAVLLQDNPDDDRNSIYFQCYSINVTESKIFKSTLSKAKRKAPTKIWKIFFLSKCVPRNFHDPSAKACLPSDMKFDDPTVVYSLTNQIRSKIFNCNKFVSNTDIKVFLQDNTIFPCYFAGSNFIDKYHRHRVTWDLRISGNNKLGKLFTKSPKYRETNNISGSKAKSTTIDKLYDYINAWWSKYGIDKSVLMG